MIQVSPWGYCFSFMFLRCAAVALLSTWDHLLSFKYNCRKVSGNSSVFLLFICWGHFFMILSDTKWSQNHLRRPKGENLRSDSNSGGSNWLVRVFKHSRSRTRAESEMDQLLLTNPRIDPKWSNRGFGSMDHQMQNFVSFPTPPLLF